MSNIFLSYAGSDLDRARTLAEALEQEGWTVFWDRTVPAGKSKSQFMEWAIDQAQSVLVLWSVKSVGSTAVQGEAEDGLKRRALVAALLDEDAAPPAAFHRVEPVNLTGWDGDRADGKFQRLASTIAEVVPRTRPAVPLPVADAPVAPAPVAVADKVSRPPQATPPSRETPRAGGRSPALLFACVVAAIVVALLIWRLL